MVSFFKELAMNFSFHKLVNGSLPATERQYFCATRCLFSCNVANFAVCWLTRNDDTDIDRNRMDC